MAVVGVVATSHRRNLTPADVLDRSDLMEADDRSGG
jgi:hypothetical protein